MATKRLFVIAVDAWDPTLDLTAIKQRIKAEKAFDGWWNHLTGVFLVASELNANEIADRILPAVGNSKLLVIEANPAESEGSLPERSWSWIQRRTHSPAKSDSESV